MGEGDGIKSKFENQEVNVIRGKKLRIKFGGEAERY